MSDITSFWRQRSLLSNILLPLSWFFSAIASLRRAKLLGKNTLSVPVIVVGNISVGGNGKTPVVIALANALTHRGLKVGIVSRGYKSKAKGITFVTPNSPASVGDEPLLIAKKTQLPVAVGAKRFDVCCALIKKYPDIEWIISDDGLQHYAMPRKVELVVMAPDLMIGNGRCLPAGPLREMPERIAQTDALLYTGNPTELLSYNVPQFILTMMANRFTQLEDQSCLSAAELPKDVPIYAFTAIARPERFFSSLEQLGLPLQEKQSLPDHSPIKENDLSFAKNGYIVVSGKDAVKMQNFSSELQKRIYVLEYETVLPKELLSLILNKGD